MGATRNSVKKKTTRGKPAMVDPRSTTEVDAVVGHRLRNARLMAGMSQQALADALGITFQQIQKYEKGVNRISFGRMLEVSRLLERPLEWFAGEGDDEDGAKIRPSASESGRAGPRDLGDAKLLRAAQQLSPTQKRLLVRLAEAMLPPVETED